MPAGVPLGALPPNTCWFGFFPQYMEIVANEYLGYGEEQHSVDKLVNMTCKHCHEDMSPFATGIWVNPDPSMIDKNAPIYIK